MWSDINRNKLYRKYLFCWQITFYFYISMFYCMLVRGYLSNTSAWPSVCQMHLHGFGIMTFLPIYLRKHNTSWDYIIYHQSLYLICNGNHECFEKRMQRSWKNHCVCIHDVHSEPQRLECLPYQCQKGPQPLGQVKKCPVTCKEPVSFRFWHPKKITRIEARMIDSCYSTVQH